MALRLMGLITRGKKIRAAGWALLSESLLTDPLTFRTNKSVLRCGLAI